nr:MAG TPA: DNA-directed RNA polymerase III subunit [Crassvirales sp.]
MEFCDNCSSTDIMTSSISEWEELYEFKYGHKFIQ